MNDVQIANWLNDNDHEIVVLFCPENPVQKYSSLYFSLYYPLN